MAVDDCIPQLTTKKKQTNGVLITGSLKGKKWIRLSSQFRKKNELGTLEEK
jgi:hypothetical protein